MTRWRIYLGHSGVALSLLSVTVAALLLVGLMSAWFNINAKLDRLDRMLPKVHSEIELLNEQLSMADLIEKNKEDAEYVVGRLHQDVRQKDIVKTLSDVTASSGTSVVEQNFDNEDIQGGVLSVSQSIVISGSYSEVRRVLTPLQNEMPGVTVIRKISIQRTPDEHILATMNIETFAAAPSE